MPIYEYRCDSCGFQKEFIQRMSDPRLTDCPECKKPTFSKMVTAAGFQLKGGGWYVTDFKGSGSAPSTSTSSSSSTESKTKTAEKSAATESSAPAASASSGDKPKAEPAKASTPTVTTPSSS
ncbi:MAG: zinc ribbon domain-containing protein [Betaproteobacteria bacterium]